MAMKESVNLANTHMSQLSDFFKCVPSLLQAVKISSPCVFCPILYGKITLNIIKGLGQW